MKGGIIQSYYVCFNLYEDLINFQTILIGSLSYSLVKL